VVYMGENFSCVHPCRPPQSQSTPKSGRTGSRMSLAS
jgi:hypothetical protein